jgi:hypothetical protein
MSSIASQSSPMISTTIIPPSSPVAVPANQNDMRNCSKCKRGKIPTHEQWKSCSSCREKSRNYNKRAAAARVALANLQIPNDNSPLTSGKRKEREDEEMSHRLDKMKKKMKNHFEENPSSTSDNSVAVSILSIDPQDAC